MTKAIVLDTNVLISALLTPFGAPARILNLVLIGDVRLFFDDRIMAEYREVMLRKKFGFPSHLVDNLLDYFEASGERVIAPPLRISIGDPGDAPFLEVAIAGDADALVTGNRRHYPTRAGVPVLSPEEFLRIHYGSLK